MSLLTTTIYISREYAKVYYSQNNLPPRLFKLDDKEKIPVCIFSNENKFEIGTVAKSFESSNPDSFYGNYFDTIKKQNKQIFVNGKHHPYQNLFQFFIEYLIRKLHSEILIDRTEINFQTFNFNFIVSNDIVDSEAIFIGKLLSSLNYKNISIVRYDYLLLNYLDINRKIGGKKQDQSDLGIFSGYTIIDEIGNDLFINFYSSNEDITSKDSKIGNRLAIDERVEIVAKMLYHQVADKTNSLTEQNSEVPLLFNIAKDIVKKLETKSEVKVSIKLSDSNSGKAKIKKHAVKEEMLRRSRGNENLDFIKHFVKRTRIEDSELEVIISQQISSPELINNIRGTFAHVYHSEDELLDIVEFYNENPIIVKKGNISKSNVSIQKPEVESEKPNDKPKLEVESEKAIDKPELEVKKPVNKTNEPKKIFAPPTPPKNNKRIKPKSPSKTTNKNVSPDKKVGASKVTPPNRPAPPVNPNKVKATPKKPVIPKPVIKGDDQKKKISRVAPPPPPINKNRKK